MSDPAGSPRAQQARNAMVEAAERIAAVRGLGAMALQAVQTEAGQANKSAARYHFGSRLGLIGAVLESRMAPVNVRRRELLTELGDVAPSSRDVARVLVLPLAAETLGRPGSHYARFLLQTMVDPEASPVAVEHLRADSFRELWQRFSATTTLPAPLAEIRFTSAVSLCVTTLATWEAHRPATVDLTAVVADLVHTCTAVLDAPAAHPTRPTGA